MRNSEIVQVKGKGTIRVQTKLGMKYQRHYRWSMDTNSTFKIMSASSMIKGKEC